MGHRPYPRADRALHQLHRGRGRVPRDVALSLAVHATLSEAMRRLREAFAQDVPVQRQFLNARIVGRTAAMQQLVDEARARGEHVHTASVAHGQRCHGGAEHCTTPPAEQVP